MENHPALMVYCTQRTVNGSRRRSNKGVNSNMPTNLDKKGLAKTMEGVSTNTKKRRFKNMLKQSDNSPDIACKQSYAENHSAQIGYIHGARNGNRWGRK